MNNNAVVPLTKCEELVDHIAKLKQARDKNFDPDEFLDILSASVQELHRMTEQLQVQNEQLDKARRQAQLERETYHALFQFAPDGYIITDCVGQVQKCNVTAATMLGVAHKSLSSKSLSVFVHKEDRPAFLRVLDDFQSGRIKGLKEFEIRLIARTGDVLVVSSNIDVIRQTDADALPGGGLRWIVRDVTERYAQQKELALKARALAAKNAELEQWAAVTAHDLKEPVRVMALYSDLLNQTYKNKLHGDGEKYLEFISIAAEKGLSLIQDLLTYHAVGSRKDCFKSVKLTKPIDDAISSLRPALSECNGKVHVGKMPTLVADSAQITQLFHNIIGNAIKFRSNEEPLFIKINSCKVDNDWWLITIEDNGIGVDTKSAERIFLPFERLNSPSEYQGNGIGLALCKKIVENHAGEITAVPNNGRGLTISVRLPVKERAETA